MWIAIEQPKRKTILDDVKELSPERLARLAPRIIRDGEEVKRCFVHFVERLERSRRWRTWLDAWVDFRPTLE